MYIHNSINLYTSTPSTARYTLAVVCTFVFSATHVQSITHMSLQPTQPHYSSTNASVNAITASTIGCWVVAFVFRTTTNLASFNCTNASLSFPNLPTCNIKKLTLNEKNLLKMYNSVIECVKVSNMCIGLKKTCLGLLERCDSIEDIQRGINA